MLRPRQGIFKWADATARPHQTTFGWITFAARIILGGAVLVSGLLKIGDLVSSLVQGRAANSEAVLSVQAYQLHFLPNWIITTVGVALPIIEILLGLAIVIGLWTRWTGALGGLMMLAFIIVIGSVWARGLRISCGCFGAGGNLSLDQQPMYWLDELRDVGLLICGVWIFLFPKSPLSIDGWIAGPTTEIEE